MSDNMNIWNYANKTSPGSTKKQGYGGQGTSINGYWMFQKATELWGSCGKGWGYEIVEETFKDGIPIGTPEAPVNSVMHTIQIRLWYKYGDKVHSVTSYGHTPYISKTKNGPLVDMEVSKKSLTDSIKKALSMLGFCSDVYQGMFDDASYIQEVVQKDIDDKEDEKTAEKEELIKYVLGKIEEIDACTYKGHVVNINKPAIRYLNRQIRSTHLAEVAKKGHDSIVRKSGEKIKELEGKDNAKSE